MKGALYLVATPIGNLDDITIRALNVLKEADIIAAEDTRHTLGLLNHFNISKPLISYYKEIEEEKSNTLIKNLIDGKNIALVSDAGTPGISDPGEVIVKKAIKNGITVVPIPGACAAITAIIASGMSTHGFSFIGFLPVSSTEKKKILKELITETKTLIFYEAPHKLIKTLESIQEVIGDRNIVLCKELTKIHEEFKRGKISDILTELDNPKGEYVIIVQGNEKNKSDLELEERNNLSLEDHYDFYAKQGLDKKEIIKQIAKDRGVNKNIIYQEFI